jgi:hypothetical protein
MFCSGSYAYGARVVVVLASRYYWLRILLGAATGVVELVNDTHGTCFAFYLLLAHI